MKDKFYRSPSYFFKIARTIFGLVNFQDFAAPSLQNDVFDLQTGWPDRPVSANLKALLLNNVISVEHKKILRYCAKVILQLRIVSHVRHRFSVLSAGAVLRLPIAFSKLVFYCSFPFSCAFKPFSFYLQAPWSRWFPFFFNFLVGNSHSPVDL